MLSGGADAPPDLAAAGARHEPSADRPALPAVLADRAAGDEDRHLAENTIACLELADVHAAIGITAKQRARRASAGVGSEGGWVGGAGRSR